jgi:hypothetical protein
MEEFGLGLLISIRFDEYFVADIEVSGDENAGFGKWMLAIMQVKFMRRIFVDG